MDATALIHSWREGWTAKYARAVGAKNVGKLSSANRNVFDFFLSAIAQYRWLIAFSAAKKSKED